MRDDIAIVQLLKMLHGTADDLDDNSIDNTIIQYFEAPHDSANLTAYFQTFVAGASLTSSPNETVTLTAQLTPNVANPSTFTWGGYNGNVAWQIYANNVWSSFASDWNLVHYDAGWFWGYGGIWK